MRDAGEPALSTTTHFADLDDDGTLDAGEPSAVSDGAGAWTITGIPAGPTASARSTPAGRTCSSPTPCSSQQTFTSGTTITGLEFGSYGAGGRSAAR